MEVVRATRVGIKEAWPGEASHFTPWLAEHLDWLAEDLDLGSLSLEATEVSVPGGRSLDILAVDASGRAVAIENQYGVVDHDHLTRGLAYAVGLQADRPVAALIVIAEAHRDEFVAVADYLNDCAVARTDGQGIRVFLVSVELDRVGAGPSSVRFTARAQPNDWPGEVRSQPPEPLAGDDAFVDELDAPSAACARRIIEAWRSRDDTQVGFTSRALALYGRNPRARNQRCHVGSLDLGRGGQLWLNPGRLRDSGAFSDAELEEFARLSSEHLPPTTTRGGKGHYFVYRLADLDPDSTMALLDWVLEVLARP